MAKKPIPNKPGVSNWVSEAGGLPDYARRIAEHLHGKGHTVSASIAMAINTLKKWATGTNHNGGKLKPETVAKAAVAIAQWEAKKASRKGKLAEGVHMSPDEQAELGLVLAGRLSLCEGMVLSLDGGLDAAVKNTRSLLEAAPGGRVNLTIGGGDADPGELAETREALDNEIEVLGSLIDGLLSEADCGSEGTAAEGSPGKCAKCGKKMPKNVKANMKMCPNCGKTVKAKDIAEAAPRGAKARALPPGGPKEQAQGKPPAKGKPKPVNEPKDDTDRVGALQRRLASLGHEVSDDGKFGPKTDEAVRTFQAHAGVKEDGVVGSITSEYLKMAPPPEVMAAAEEEDEHPTAVGSAPVGDAPEGADAPPVAPGAEKSGLTPLVYKGMGVGGQPDATVKGVQGKLNATGMNLEEDGVFGPETEKRTKSFQKKWGLRADGMVGPKTQNALGIAGAKVAELKEARLAVVEATDGRSFTRARARERVLARRLEEGNAGLVALVAKLMASGKFQSEEQAKAVAAKLISSGKVKMPTAARGGSRKAKIEMKRLPNGHFAPKGQGNVLKAGDLVDVPHKSGKGFVSGIAGDKDVELMDGPDAGYKGKLAQAEPHVNQYDAATAKNPDAGIGQPGPQAPKPKPGTPEYDDVLLANMKAGQAKKDAKDASKKKGETKVGPQEIDGPQYASMLAKHEKEKAAAKSKAQAPKPKSAKDEKAAAAYPEGTTVTTTVASIGGKQDKVSGTVTGHKYGQLVVKTASQGNIVVPLKDVEGGPKPPESPGADTTGDVFTQTAIQSALPGAKVTKTKEGFEVGGFSMQPAEAQKKLKDYGLDVKDVYGQTVVTGVTGSDGPGNPFDKPAPGPDDLALPKPPESPGTAQMAGGVPVQPNSEGLSIKDMPLGTIVIIKDQAYRLHKNAPTNAPGGDYPWIIMKPVDDNGESYGKAKVMHPMNPPPFHGPLEEPSMTPAGAPEPEAAPAPDGGDLMGQLSDSVAAGAKGELPQQKKKELDPWIAAQNAGGITQVAADEEAKAGGIAKANAKAKKGKDYGSMSNTELAAAIKSAHQGGDAQAVEAMKAEAEKRGVKPTVAMKSVTASLKDGTVTEGPGKTLVKHPSDIAAGLEDLDKADGGIAKANKDAEKAGKAGKAAGAPKSKLAAATSPALSDSPGRGPKGNIRNMKAMGKPKLAALIKELEDFGGDPEALSVAKAAAAAKGFEVAAPAKPSVTSYDPKTGPSAAEKAKNAAEMGLKPKSKPIAGKYKHLTDPSLSPEEKAAKTAEVDGKFVGHEFGPGEEVKDKDGTVGKVVAHHPHSSGNVNKDKFTVELPDGTTTKASFGKFNEMLTGKATWGPKRAPSDKTKTPGEQNTEDMKKDAAPAGTAFPIDYGPMLVGSGASVPVGGLSAEEIDYELAAAEKTVAALDSIPTESMVYSPVMYKQAKAAVDVLKAEQEKRAGQGDASNAALAAYKAAGGVDQAVIDMLQKAA